MELYKGTPRIKVDECCRQFYDNNIFSGASADSDTWSTFPGTVARSVNEIGLLFSGTDRVLIYREMAALGLEVFALAYALKVKMDILSWRQSSLAKNYLVERGETAIWDIMGEYNEVFAQSGIAEKGTDKVTAARDKMYRKWLKSVEKDRPSADKGIMVADDYVNRAANLIGTEMKQADGILAERLAARLSERLGQGTGLKRETLHKVSAVIFDFYRGAELYLKYVSLHV